MNYPEFIKGNSVRWEVPRSQFRNTPLPRGRRVTATSEDDSYGGGGEAEAVSRENRLREDLFLFLSRTN